MQNWFQRILLFIAVATIIGHNTLPHDHHDQIDKVANHQHEQEPGTGAHHEHNDEDTDGEHSVFSFAQLDENFVPVKFQDITIGLPIVYLLTPVITYHSHLFTEKSKTQFGFYKEYPPPGTYLSQLPSRGPPSLSSLA
jgi:hypothetical protein